MNPTDYYEIHIELVHAISGLWEIWLTITFAVVVAIHIGRKSINRTLLWIGCSLYLASSLTAITRYLSYTGSIRLIEQDALDAGFTPFPMDWNLGIAVGMLTLITMIGGTIATVTFAVYQHRSATHSLEAASE